MMGREYDTVTSGQPKVRSEKVSKHTRNPFPTDKSLDGAFIKKTLTESADTLKAIPQKERSDEQQILLDVLLSSISSIDDRSNILQVVNSISDHLDDQDERISNLCDITKDLQGLKEAINQFKTWGIDKDNEDETHNNEIDQINAALRRIGKDVDSNKTFIDHEKETSGSRLKRIENLEEKVTKMSTWNSSRVGQYIAIFGPIIAALVVILGWWGNNQFATKEEFNSRITSTKTELRDSIESLEIKLEKQNENLKGWMNGMQHDFQEYKLENQKSTNEILMGVKIIELRLSQQEEKIARKPQPNKK